MIVFNYREMVVPRLLTWVAREQIFSMNERSMGLKKDKAHNIRVFKQIHNSYVQSKSL